jgi:hypothetical protein
MGCIVPIIFNGKQNAVFFVIHAVLAMLGGRFHTAEVTGSNPVSPTVFLHFLQALLLKIPFSGANDAAIAQAVLS